MSDEMKGGVMNKCSNGQYPDPEVWCVCYGPADIDGNNDGPFLATCDAIRRKRHWIDSDGDDVTKLVEFWAEVPSP